MASSDPLTSNAGTALVAGSVIAGSAGATSHYWQSLKIQGACGGKDSTASGKPGSALRPSTCTSSVLLKGVCSLENTPSASRIR